MYTLRSPRNTPPPPPVRSVRCGGRGSALCLAVRIHMLCVHIVYIYICACAPRRTMHIVRRRLTGVSIDLYCVMLSATGVNL